MRSSAGIVAGLFLFGLVANCGGDDGGTTTPTGGTTSTAAGEGGQGNVGNTNVGGTINVSGTKNMGGDAGGTPPMVECSKDEDCGAGSKCLENVCKKDDGQSCTESAECQNACIDGMCTSKGDDGATCTADGDCAHTCIDGMCAPPSDLGGDCDVDLGTGGAGGAGGAPASTGGAAGAGGAPEVQNPDCKAPLECVTGKCLTPDGEACTDNPDCVNTCVANKCQPKSPLDGACDDLADCDDGGGTIKVVCDQTKKLCKLDVTSICQVNGQCQSNRCVCANADCSVRACKTPDSVCQCKWSQTDAPSCDNSSANLTTGTKDPNGCSGANLCNKGQCVADAGGSCSIGCVYHAAAGDQPAFCSSNGPSNTCNGGYHAVAGGDCTIVKGTTTCSAACSCDLN